ncbi:hypothetical protein X975_06285, partial [Stegodyphus mimosarum]
FRRIGVSSLKDLQTISVFDLKSKLSCGQFNIWTKASHSLPFSDDEYNNLVENLWTEIEKQEKESW